MLETIMFRPVKPGKRRACPGLPGLARVFHWRQFYASFDSRAHAQAAQMIVNARGINPR